jgi:hypothetical protein
MSSVDWAAVIGKSESGASTTERMPGTISSGSPAVRRVTIIARTPPPTESSIGL